MSMTGISKYAPMLFPTDQKYRTFTSAFKLKKSRPISRKLMIGSFSHIH
jgi:hypothetical protein